MAKTIRMMCMMQEHGLSKQEILQLEQHSKALYKQYFGDAYQLMPVWIVIPRGQAYLAAKPSTTTTVTIAVEDNLSDDIRHAYMAEFCRMWMGITQCHINEIIFNAPDRSVSESFINAQLERINPRIRKFTMLLMLIKLFKSKLTRGYFSMSMNMNQ